jgi:hypothetical protein
VPGHGAGDFGGDGLGEAVVGRAFPDGAVGQDTRLSCLKTCRRAALAPQSFSCIDLTLLAEEIEIARSLTG